MKKINSPLVSVLMPTLNAMPYLSEAIGSVFSQTYTNWELVIVHEKASTDSTEEFLAQLNDPRVKVILCENDNISAALNIGIEACKGKYIARMDSDNIMTTDRLEKQVAYMESHPEIGLSGGTCQAFGNANWVWQPPVEPDDICTDILFFQPFSHSVFMLRKESLSDIRYNESQVCEDYEIMTRLAFKTKIGAIQDIILFFRLHDGMKTITMNGQAQSDSVKSTERFYRNLGLEKVSTDVCSFYGKIWDDVTGENLNEKLGALLTELGKIYVQLLQKDSFEPHALRKVIRKRWNRAFESCVDLRENLEKAQIKFAPLVNLMLGQEDGNDGVKADEKVGTFEDSLEDLFYKLSKSFLELTATDDFEHEAIAIAAKGRWLYEFRMLERFYRKLGLNEVSADACSLYGKIWEDVTAEHLNAELGALLTELSKIYVQLLQKDSFEPHALRKAIHKRWNYTFVIYDELRENLEKARIKFAPLVNLMLGQEDGNDGVKADEKVRTFEDNLEDLLYELGKSFLKLTATDDFEHETIAMAVTGRWLYEFRTLSDALAGQQHESLERTKYDALFNIMFESRRSLPHVKRFQNPTISVVMPTAKVTSDLYVALMTLRAQTYKNFEVIIVNDGNPSLVKYTLLFLNDERFRLLQNKKRLGIAKSLNRGILESKAKYIARADADDWYRPERFMKQVKFLEKHPEVSLVSTWQHTVYNNKIVPELLPKNHEAIKARLLFGCWLSHTSCMWRREDFVKNNLFYDSDYDIEDFELWNRAVMTLKFHCIDDPLVYYRTRVRKGSRTSILKEEKIDAGFRRIIRNNFARLNVFIDDSENWLLKSWVKPLEKDDPLLYLKIARLREVLLQLLENNKSIRLYNQKSLTDAVRSRWEDATAHLPHQAGYRLKSLYDKNRLSDIPWVRMALFSFRKRAKKLLYPLGMYANEKLDTAYFYAFNKLMLTAKYSLSHRTPQMKQKFKNSLKEFLREAGDRFNPDDEQTYEKVFDYATKLKDRGMHVWRRAEVEAQRIKHKKGSVSETPAAPSADVTQVQNGLIGMGRYLATHNVKKLQINCGSNMLDGWLNTDLFPQDEKGIYHLDLLERFPFEDGTFDYLFSEHGVEHFKIEELDFILKECCRVLKKGGKMRISTPDLNKLINFYLTDDKENKEYRSLHQDLHLPFSKKNGIVSKALVLNNFFRDWGHQVIYDEETFCQMLSHCGFGNIVRVGIGESDEPVFQNVDRHDRQTYKVDIAEFESMIFECAKL